MHSQIDSLVMLMYQNMFVDHIYIYITKKKLFGVAGTYNQILGTNNNPTKTSWPELEGVTAEEAEKKIKEEIAGVEIQVVPPDSFVTADFKPQRVRLYVDESHKVTRPPKIG
ncbi:hypothetical protein RIF29_38198 [Crotalaria pallida]|uniref:Uncharacterized protein n=1 Tax=Crotalaria pallida TaxID=3830 RepID=A0AAN9DYU9_CROPI